MSPAAGEVKESSGQKYCVSINVLFSSTSVDSQVGMTCSSNALWRGGICLAKLRAPPGNGSLLYFLNIGGSRFRELKGPHRSGRRVGRSGMGDCKRVMISLTWESEFSTNSWLISRLKIEIVSSPVA
jgi:hypothetical protein